MNFKKQDIKLVWVACCGFILFLILYVLPFAFSHDPEALQHRISREDAEVTALQFVREHISSEGEYQAFGVYAADSLVLGYFDQIDKLEDMTASFQEKLPLEMYRVEVTNADTGSRYEVDVNPYTGKPVEWSLAGKGKAVTEEGLRLTVSDELQKRGLFHDIEAKLIYVDANNSEAVYELRSPAFGDAVAVFSARADGSGIFNAKIRWDVPERYVTEVERQHFWSTLLGTGGFLLSILLQLSALIYMIIHSSRIRPMRGWALALIYTALYLGIQLNMYPAFYGGALGILEGGDAAAGGSPSGAVLFTLLFSSLIVVFFGLGLYFSAVAGDALQQRTRSRLWPDASVPGYGSHVLASVGRGYLFAFILIGFQSVLIVASKAGLGSWFSIDPYSSPHNMLYPLLMPLLAWCAALSEEAVYRWFAIPAFKKILRFTFPAVLASSILWGLGHVQYPVYPFYTRLIEVSLIGVLFAYIFMRYGFFTAVFAHAVTDTIWMGIAVTANSPTIYGWLAFLGYFAVPAVIGWTVATVMKVRAA